MIPEKGCIGHGKTSADNGCHTCDSINDPNGWSNKPDGTSCSDFNPCTNNDKCEEGGTCTGAAIPGADFIDMLNGLTYDCEKQLEWQKTPGPQQYNWQGAEDYCGTLEFHGTGWGLPTEKELTGTCGADAYFNDLSGLYHTKTLAVNPPNMVVVNFPNCSVDEQSPAASAKVRCKRPAGSQ